MLHVTLVNGVLNPVNMTIDITDNRNTEFPCRGLKAGKLVMVGEAVNTDQTISSEAG